MKFILPFIVAASNAVSPFASSPPLSVQMDAGLEQGAMVVLPVDRFVPVGKNPESRNLFSREGNILTLSYENEKENAYWCFQNIPIRKDELYIFRLAVKGEKGQKYNVYLESGGKGIWQNAGVRIRTASGNWENISFNVKFTAQSALAYCVLKPVGKGRIEFKDVSIEKPLFETVADGGFENGVKAWSCGADCSVIATPNGHGLELRAQKPGMVARVIGPEIGVRPNQLYKLSFKVYGEKGMGDSSGSHVFRLYPEKSNIPNMDKWLDCMGTVQNKTLSFRTLPHQTSIRLVAEAKYPAGIVIDDVAIERAQEPVVHASLQLDTPYNYRDGVFASLPSKNITGHAVFITKDAVRALLTPLTPPGATLPLDRNNAAFTLPVPSTGSKADYRFEVFDSAGKTLLAEPLTLRSFSPAKNEVVFDRNGTMLVNGKKFFHIGHWWTTNRGEIESEVAFLREAGINTLLMRWSPDVLDIARRHDMKVILQLPERIGEPGASAEAKEKARADLTTRIRRCADHPAFLAWFGADEPLWRGVPLEPMKEVYNLVREIDPCHPVWANEAPRGELPDLKRYATVADVYGIDIYPVPEGNPHSELADKSLTAVGAYTDIAHAAVSGRKPVWMILQSFAWAHCIDPDAPVEKAVYPTWEQNRFMAYNAIQHGATGLQYHYLGYSKKVPDSFWRDLRKVTLELEYLSPVLTQETLPPPEFTGSAPGVRILHKGPAGDDTWFVVNENPKNVSVRIRLGNRKTGRVNVLFGDSLPVKDGWVDLNLSGHGVAVLAGRTFASPDTIWKVKSYRPYSEKLPESPKMSLLRKSQWIWFPGESRTPRSKCVFRLEFNLDTAVRKAVLFLFADDRFHTIRMNGSTPLNANGSAIDLTSELKKGCNTLTFHAEDSGAIPCGVVALLKIVHADGSKQYIHSGKENWSVSRDGVSDWQPPEVLGNYGCLPWGVNSFLSSIQP